MRLSGQGNKGIAGGPPGDLIVQIHIMQDAYFKRKGNDVYVDTPINIVQALLGTKLPVKTIYGKTVNLSIKPGTQNNTSFRLKGIGVKSKYETGDMFVNVNVEIPKQLNKKQVQLLKEFAEVSGLKY